MNIIHIRLSEDLPTRKQNELRYRIELGLWRRKWRAVEAVGDYAEMDRLDWEYNSVGLP